MSHYNHVINTAKKTFNNSTYVTHTVCSVSRGSARMTLHVLSAGTSIPYSLLRAQSLNWRKISAWTQKEAFSYCFVSTPQWFPNSIPREPVKWQYAISKKILPYIGCSERRLIGHRLTRVIKTQNRGQAITLDGVTLTDSLIGWSPNEWPSVCRDIPVSADKMFRTSNKPTQWTLYSVL
jgi:hypothetical protein